MAINIEQLHIAVGTYEKSVFLIKKVQSYSYSYEFYWHLLLSLACITRLCLYYTLLVYSFNLFSFLIRSKINHLIGCCLSLHFLWILYFALGLLQHGDIELNPRAKLNPFFQPSLDPK